MNDRQTRRTVQNGLLVRFWRGASGFWKGAGSWRAWLLCMSLLIVVVAQLVTQYWLNYWNRDFFNALEQKDAGALGRAMLQFFPLVALSTALAIVSVWGRMTTQRNWRRYLTSQLIETWLAGGRFRKLGHLNGSGPRNPEYRIAEDTRVATDAPIDLVLSLFSAVLTAGTFIGILASVGGSLTIDTGGMRFVVPGYLVFGVVAYSGLVTAAMLLIGRRLTGVVQDQVQAEATFRAAANLIRERGDGIVTGTGGSEERHALWEGLRNVIRQWRNLCWQIMRTTFVTHGNNLVSPVVGLLLCTPKYLAGAMTLGEVTQAAAAFVAVQGAFTWFVDNFQRMADWRAAAYRVATLMVALDELQRPEPNAGEIVAESAV